MRPSLFIGSATKALPLAHRFKTALSDVADVEVWDKGIFRLSRSTLASLLNALPRFDYGIFLLTPADLTTIGGQKRLVPRDNVVFELGLFYGQLGPSRTFMLVPHGCKRLHLPTDLAGITYQGYTAPHAIKDACDAIRAEIRATGIDSYRHLLGANHTTVSQLLLSPLLSRSPFVYHNLLRRATREVFIAAQNFHHIAVADAAASRARLFSFLRKSPKRKVRILACDATSTPLNHASIAAWSFVTGSRYGQHLKRGTSTLVKWAREARKAGLNLDVRFAALVPVSVTFVDPSDPQRAELVFTPNFYQPIAGGRACYYLNYKQHRDVFEAYWTRYEQVFNDARQAFT